MDPLSTFHICPFHFCAISEARALNYVISLLLSLSSVHFQWWPILLPQEQFFKQSHCRWTRSLWFIHPNEQTTTKRQNGTGFSRLWFQLHKQQGLTCSGHSTARGTGWFTRNVFQASPSCSPGIPMMYRVTTETKSIDQTYKETIVSQTTRPLFLPGKHSFTSSKMDSVKDLTFFGHVNSKWLRTASGVFFTFRGTLQ